MSLKTKDIVFAGLVAAITAIAEKVINNYSKNKTVNTVATVGGSFLAVEYLRSNNLVPLVGDIDINRKKKNE